MATVKSLLCRTPSTSFLQELFLRKAGRAFSPPIIGIFILLFFLNSSHCASVQFETHKVSFRLVGYRLAPALAQPSLLGESRLCLFLPASWSALSVCEKATALHPSSSVKAETQSTSLSLPPRYNPHRRFCWAQSSSVNPFWSLLGYSIAPSSGLQYHLDRI